MLEINVNVIAPDIVRSIGLLVETIKGGAASVPAPVPAAPASAPVVAPAPVTTAPIAEAPSYTTAQVAKAGADLMSANPMLQPALVDLIRRYGAQTVQDIPQDRLGAFATELRQMGAKI